MSQACKECGSHAINHHLHGRDGSDDHLCDVCYWRKRAVIAPKPSTAQMVSNSFTNEDLEGMAHGDSPVANAYMELLGRRQRTDNFEALISELDELGKNGDIGIQLLLERYGF